MALSQEFLAEHSEHLSAYKAACEKHPDLKSFDSALQKQTIKAIGDLTDESENKPVSPYAAHKVISQHVVDVTEGVTKFITEGDYNIRESEALKGLVDAYFESTKKTLDILNTIENCVEDAEMGQLFIREAVVEFKNEDLVGGKKKKYEKTLESLNKFKAVGDPFSGKVIKNQFELIVEQHKSLMNAVKETKEKLKKEIDNLEEATKIINRVSIGVVAFLLVGGLALIIFTGGLGAVVGVGSVLTGLAGVAGWAVTYTALRNKIKALEEQMKHLEKLEKLGESTEVDIKLDKDAMDDVSTQVDRLEHLIQNVLKLADYTTEDEDDNEAKTRLYLEEICGKVEKLTKEIKEVGESVENHIKLILEARLHVEQKINRCG